MKSCCSNFFQIFDNFDFFGVPVVLYIDQNPKLKSKFGAIISILVLFGILFIFANNVKIWKNLENIKIISSLTTISTNELVSEGKIISYNFNHDNYYIYFFPSLTLPNGTTLNHTQLAKYFRFVYQYLDNTGVLHDMDTQPCNKSMQNIFLGLDPQKTANDRSKWSLCVENASFPMGLFPQESGFVYQSGFGFVTYACENSTENENFCASPEEIYNISSSIIIQATIPKTIFDFKNTQNPRKNIYEYEFYNIDKSMSQIYKNLISPVVLETDIGVFSADYAIESVNFNSDKLTLQSVSRNSIKDPFMQYLIQFNYNTQTYTRQNIHFLDILGMMGGSISIMMLVARMIASSYNNIWLRYLLVNMEFVPSHAEQQNMIMKFLFFKNY